MSHMQLCTFPKARRKASFVVGVPLELGAGQTALGASRQPRSPDDAAPLGVKYGVSCMQLSPLRISSSSPCANTHVARAEMAESACLCE